MPPHTRRVTTLHEVIGPWCSDADWCLQSDDVPASHRKAHISDTADRLELVNERVSVQRGVLLDNITALRSEVVEVATSVNTLKASLREAVASAALAAGSGPGRSGGPAVSAAGDSLVVSAAGPVRVESGRCAVDDLCGATAFASSLQDALDGI